MIVCPSVNKNILLSLMVFFASMMGFMILDLLEGLSRDVITPMSVTTMVGFSAVIAFIHWGYVR